ncbi:hypothetical protein EJ05DRAFT_373932 [Pseudovirgaria hyperparasitica]|uniref:Uncharacterized protein n=1 Tax=Pseudovirgaria hyperparasitica TaxID=470096 RepID=A0A6A6W635_9PEZI|nr:uncharacterized protein EJ05DRAFT_373932 [Pseudovirgaria hyperparasitica]KAF2758005.1 hypothetical protein EJ05DRAFT_373932 [Pseudovirgaria hyperparasitica]
MCNSKLCNSCGDAVVSGNAQTRRYSFSRRTASVCVRVYIPCAPTDILLLRIDWEKSPKPPSSNPPHRQSCFCIQPGTPMVCVTGSMGPVIMNVTVQSSSTLCIETAQCRFLISESLQQDESRRKANEEPKFQRRSGFACYAISFESHPTKLATCLLPVGARK